jgi:hypothetical protein
MASTFTDKLRAFAHRKLEGADQHHPVVRHALNWSAS